MAMLRLAVRALRVKLSVLTVNHDLRPEAALEAEKVREWTTALGIEHHTLVWSAPQPAQSKARTARYDLMADWCEAHAVSWLLTAHTLDDQAETVLMRLARTASLDSLAGIPRLGHWRAIRLLRPLLSERHQTLRDMLRGLGQQWVEDPSNEDERYERVRIRKALPQLAALGITAESLSELAAQATQAVHALSCAADDWVALHAKAHDAGYCAIPRNTFAGQTKVLQARILGRLLSRYGAGLVPEPAELAHLADWAVEGSSRRTLGGAIIAARKAHLLIGREPGRISTAPVMVPASGEMFWDGRFTVWAKPGSQIIPEFCAGTSPRHKDFPAFVQKALPAVIMAGGGICIPHLGVGSGAEAVFQP